jgi:hypothetical protein
MGVVPMLSTPKQCFAGVSPYCLGPACRLLHPLRLLGRAVDYTAHCLPLLLLSLPLPEQSRLEVAVARWWTWYLWARMARSGGCRV